MCQEVTDTREKPMIAGTLMDGVVIGFQTDNYMKDNLLVVNKTGQEYIIGQMEINIMDNFLMVK